jgi:hypothetical protein
MDAGTKRLALIAGGLGAALLAVVGVWSVGERKGGHIPVVEADSRPLRVKPDNPGGLQVAGTNDEILSGESGPQAGKLAPPPEAPEPQALRSQQQAPRPPESTAPMTSASPAAPAVAPATRPSAQGQATHGSAAQAPAQPVEAPKGETAARQAAAHAGSAYRPTEVQLAAVPSEDAAKAEWDRLAKKMPDLLNGRRPAVSRTERDGRTYWRLRTGGFSDIAQATAFCGRVRAKGAGCSIASF